jgi:hypothetical protein
MGLDPLSLPLHVSGMLPGLVMGGRAVYNS